MRVSRVMLVGCTVLLAQNARAADAFDRFGPLTIGGVSRNLEKLAAQASCLSRW